jgi:DNA polymerase zeta
MLDAKQLTLKLLANVTYGYTSASFSGRMPSVEIADSIVSAGRETLERVRTRTNGFMNFATDFSFSLVDQGD